MNIPELHNIENTDFVDNMTLTQCRDLLIKLGAEPFRNAPFLAAIMPDGDIIESSYVEWDGNNKIEAIRDLTKNCIDHYLLTN